jgi:hypothetical protein
MSLFSIFRRAPPDRSSSETEKGEDNRPPPRSPYSLQYETIVAQGHERPTPSFGAPTLTWHVAIWPRSGRAGHEQGSDACDPHDTAGCSHEVARERSSDDGMHGSSRSIPVCAPWKGVAGGARAAR